MLAPGYVIGGRYRLTRLLGEGGMGVVWAAVNDAFGREVAIKVMLPAVAASDPTALERFFTEARICGSIRHPGIVDVLDVGRAETGAPYLVMELLDGGSLDNVIRRAGVLRPLDVLPVIRDVARTLALAHEKGVIHRDLKPGNVFLHRLPNGQIVAKVLDFGVSKVAVKNTPATLTRTGTVVGSPAYMSPEQAGGRLELDQRSDVYALGVIMYEALAGRLPFLEQNYNALMIDIAVRDPPSLAAVTSGLPKAVLDLVKATMAHDRENRIPTAAALADRIETTLSALGASPAHPLPDPASLVGTGAPPSTARSIVAQTGSALATNAGIRTRRASPVLLGLGAMSIVLLLGGAGLLWKVYRVKTRVAVAPPPSAAAVVSATVPPASASEVASAAPTSSATVSAAAETPTALPTATSAAPVSSTRVPLGKAKPPPKKGEKGGGKDPIFGIGP